MAGCESVGEVKSGIGDADERTEGSNFMLLCCVGSVRCCWRVVPQLTDRKFCCCAVSSGNNSRKFISN